MPDAMICNTCGNSISGAQKENGNCPFCPQAAAAPKPAEPPYPNKPPIQVNVGAAAPVSQSQAAREILKRIASRQKALLWGILILLVGSCPGGMALGMLPQDISGVVYALLLVLIAIIQAILIYRLCLVLCLEPAWLWVLGAFFPYAGLIVLLIVNQKASKVLQQAGVRVGLMGASKF